MSARTPLVLLGWIVLGCSLAPARAAAPQEGDETPLLPLRQGDGEAHAYPGPLLPGADYDPALRPPDELLGRPWGSRVASHAELLEVLREWAQASPRATLESYGQTFEGRELVRLVITSPANHARLDALLADHQRLFDPRGLGSEEGAQLVARLPAVAWMGYSIHGDETSGSDAAPLVAYHLLAGRDQEVRALLDEVVVVLDPCLNPDGRERIRAMLVWSAGYRSNLNHESLHRGRWPYGRGNHYLFDMNRDWMAGVCPETRGRWAVLQRFHPQLFVDAHEMSALDTFLLYPQSPPHNPELPASLFGWQARFADDAAGAFDARGWGYYTREWADAWYPGYSDAWGSLNGAVGMLYEQARLGGQAVMRASGEVVTYREAVHHQLVASLANLETLRAHRAAVMEDYLAARRAAVHPARPDAERAFVFRDVNRARTTRFLGTLLAQGVQVERAGEPFTARDGVTSLGERFEERELPAGTYLVRSRQPQSRLVHAYLDFSPRIDEESVRDERERLERGEGSRLYDVSAWDLGRQLDLEAAWCTPGDVPAQRVEVAPRPVGRVDLAASDRPYAWATSAADDRSVAFAARALELGLAVHVSDRDFALGLATGAVETLPRGSLLLRRHENPGDVDALVERAARESGALVLATDTGRAQDGERPDLGGGHFHLLQRPRVALVSGDPVSTSDFGHLWHHLDVELGMEVTLLEARELGRYDLRRYNVLVLPPMRGVAAVLEPAKEDLAAWVRSGGTLVACGSSAAGITGESLGLTAVVRRRDALEELDAYAESARRQAASTAVAVDYPALWDEPDGDAGEEASGEGEGDGGERDDAGTGPSSGPASAIARRDEWMRRFMPGGVILRGLVDEHSWLTVGARGAELPVPCAGSSVLLTHGRAAVRLAPAKRLRLGGLLWPEARERLADSAWLCRERRGRGQVVLFAHTPVFRGSYLGTARLFSNAVVLGPGQGADHPVGW